VQAVASVLAAIVNVAVSIVLVMRIGSLGVILGTIISYLVVLVIPQSVAVLSAMRNLQRDRPRRGATAGDVSIDVQPIL
jgi:O-antigen/teichoic acid export membrane protein